VLIYDESGQPDPNLSLLILLADFIKNPCQDLSAGKKH
jgi:hypothetical protein